MCVSKPAVDVMDSLASEFGLARPDVIRALSVLAVNLLDEDMLRGACVVYRARLERVAGQEAMPL